MGPSGSPRLLRLPIPPQKIQPPMNQYLIIKFRAAESNTNNTSHPHLPPHREHRPSTLCANIIVRGSSQSPRICNWSRPGRSSRLKLGPKLRRPPPRRCCRPSPSFRPPLRSSCGSNSRIRACHAQCESRRFLCSHAPDQLKHARALSSIGPRRARVSHSPNLEAPVCWPPPETIHHPKNLRETKPTFCGAEVRRGLGLNLSLIHI